jgi:secreted PhoX family phosphatase
VTLREDDGLSSDPNEATMADTTLDRRHLLKASASATAAVAGFAAGAVAAEAAIEAQEHWTRKGDVQQFLTMPLAPAPAP